MFQLIKPNLNLDFVGKRHLWAGLSVVAIVGSLVLLGTKGLNYGIDFSGGAEVHIKAPVGWTTERIRDVLGKTDLKDPGVKDIPETTEFIVRAKGDEKTINEVASKVKDAFAKASPDQPFEILRSEIVGPAAGSTLRNQGMLAMFYVLLVILIYVTVRFDARYAPGAVLALFHDTMIVLGVYVVTGRQFDLTILGALLALIGYSNNDTIIVFDRVRETVHLHPEYSIERTVNVSVNETLGRTLVTSLTTFLVAFALWMWGGPVLENFAFMFMIGIVIGTYSSIFVASSLVIYLTKMVEKGKQGGARNNGGRKGRTYAVRPEPSHNA